MLISCTNLATQLASALANTSATFIGSREISSAPFPNPPNASWRSRTVLKSPVVLSIRSFGFVLSVFLLSLEVEAATTVVAPASLSTNRGTRSSQAVLVLATEEESGQSDGWSNY